MTYLDESTMLFATIDNVCKQRAVGAGAEEHPPPHPNPTLLRRLKSCPVVHESTTANPSGQAGEGAAKAAPALMSRRAGGLKRAMTLDLAAIRLPAASPAEGSGETMGEYSSLEVLGRGAFGSVYRACQEKTGQTVALKTFHIHDGDGVAGSARSEHRMLCQLSHPHIVKAIDFFVHDGAKEVIVMEFFAGATISRAVRKMAGKGFAEADARALFKALLEALGYMHRNGYVHSLAVVLDGEAPNERNDVWGAGVCLHAMLSGRVPDLCGAPAGSADGLKEVPLAGTRWANVSDGARSATRQCLALDADLRPTASAMSEHPWVSNSEVSQVAASNRLRKRFATN